MRARKRTDGFANALRTALVAFALVLVTGGAPAGQTLGLVLSGGGAKGAYEIGVWKALEEAGLSRRIRVFSGTSVGAINAALFASAGEAAACADVWRKTFAHASGPITSDASDRLRRRLASALPKRWPDSAPFVYATALAKESLKLKRFRLNGMDAAAAADGLMASAALPPVFPPVVIDGVAYVDGGADWSGRTPPDVFDKTPLAPIRDGHPEVDTVIVVYLEDARRLKRRWTAADFPRGRLIEIVPSADISASHDGRGGAMDFSPENLLRLQKLGYDDARDVLSRVQPGHLNHPAK